MQRRGAGKRSARDQPAKKRKTARKTSTARSSIDLTQEQLIKRLKRERDEAVESQAASAEVLKIIGSSPGDMTPVFEAMLANAMRLCDAKFGHILLYDGERFHPVHLHDVPPPYRAFWDQRGPIKPSPTTGLGRLARTRKVIHIADLKDDSAYMEREPLRVVTVEKAGARSFLAVPMLKDDELVGAIVIYRREVRPFAEKQIELVKTFAAQAVIAIENARLLQELRQRTEDLGQALEQQTATTEILRVISQSAADVRPVFDSIVLAAVRLLHCDRSFFQRCDRTTYSPMSMATFENGLVEVDATRRLPIDPTKNFPSRAIIEKKTLYLPDISTMELPKHERRVYEKYGNKSGLFVPLIHDEQCIGLLVFAGKRANAFTEREIALAESFRDQALIAVENARLFNEVQAKTRNLEESLRQQTATSEVLQVISSSPGDLAPVFEKMLENAVRVCGAEFGIMLLLEDGLVRPAARYNMPPAFAAPRRDVAYHPHAGSVLARAIESKDVAQIADMRTSPAYLEGAQSAVALVELGGARTVAVVPMLRDNEVIGTITIYRQEVRLFEDKQIDLIKNFAKQAVIAVENARLLRELRERT
jgi:two-component system, NtrC family, sensor kinase